MKNADSGRSTVRIGGASGFWGDSRLGAPQLVRSGRIDFLVFDYLAETTMAILATARARKPAMGYATDFVEPTMREILPEVMGQGIRVIANAGGINPQGCADALLRVAATQGLSPRVAVVEGDDVSGRIEALRGAGTRDMFTGALLPEGILSANAYLGALPIARALDEGADIVITGRCVDSATTLGALVHAFAWSATDYDRLAAGSLAGHIAECGCQATGGLFTDWESVPDWPNIGYPILECAADGSFVVGKAPGTGGAILRAAVAEQLLYEIGDPAAYLLPDVTCDFRDVRIEQLDRERVAVSGARGLPPPSDYKVSATYADGYRCAGSLVIIGIDAVAKARRTGEAIVDRTRRMLLAAGLGDYTATRVEVIGGETLYGPHGRADRAREVMLRVVCDHPKEEALQVFAREIMPAGTSWAPGTGTPGGGRPSPSPLVRPFAFLLDKRSVQAEVVIGGRRIAVAPTPSTSAVASASRSIAPRPVLEGRAPHLISGARALDPISEARTRPPILETDPAPPAWIESAASPSVWQEPTEPMVEVPLVRLAWARSGDKGDISNIGVIARRPEWLPLLWARLTPAVVKDYFAHLVQGRVERHYLPGIAAMNFVLHEALDGGGPASMRMDPLGKGMGQMLLDLPIRVPRSVAERAGIRSDAA